MDASEHLVNTIYSRKDELIAALLSSGFYIELFLIGMALLLAWLVAMSVRRRAMQHLKAHPPRHLDTDLVVKPLALLAPLLALIFLSLIRPLTQRWAGTGGDWTDATMQLCFAYMLARLMILVVRSQPVGWFIATVIMIVGVLRASGFISSTVAYLRSVTFDIGQYQITMLNVVHSAVILVIVFWIAGATSRTLESYLRRSSRLSYNARELSVKFFRLFVYFVALLITLSALGVDLTAFAVFGGALGVGIGLGLQKITANFVSGVTLLLEKSVQIGDLLEIGGESGWVRQLNIRYMLLETFDGREVLIPNEELISTRVTNWTHSNQRARVSVEVGVAYGTDPRLVLKLIMEAATEHTRCLKDPEPKCWLRKFNDSSLDFLLTFWVNDVREGRYGPQSDVMLAILDKFKANGIEIPFPQRDIHIIAPKDAA